MSEMISDALPSNAVATDVMSAEVSDVNAEAAQFITFRIGEEEFGVDIVKVREIKGWTETTNLPSAPSYMLGVLNLRGIIVPTYDLRARFGLGHTEPSKSHVIVIVTVGGRIFGILVDAVSDILTVATRKIRPVPEMGGDLDQRFLSGLVTIESRMVALLDLSLLFDLDALPDEIQGGASNADSELVA
jgi:purine-binding chemotaxis protein CheW